MFGLDLTWFIPIFVLLGLILLLVVVSILGRWQGGRYLRPVVMLLAKVGFVRRLMEKASRKAIERSNPELARAMSKLERSGALRDPQRAQTAMSSLSADERRAYLEAAGDFGAIPEGVNRAQRRRLEKMRKAQRGR